MLTLLPQLWSIDRGPWRPSFVGSTALQLVKSLQWRHTDIAYFWSDIFLAAMPRQAVSDAALQTIVYQWLVTLYILYDNTVEASVSCMQSVEAAYQSVFSGGGSAGLETYQTVNIHTSRGLHSSVAWQCMDLCWYVYCCLVCFYQNTSVFLLL